MLGLVKEPEKEGATDQVLPSLTTNYNRLIPLKDVIEQESQAQFTSLEDEKRRSSVKPGLIKLKDILGANTQPNPPPHHFLPKILESRERSPQELAIQQIDCQKEVVCTRCIDQTQPAQCFRSGHFKWCIKHKLWLANEHGYCATITNSTHSQSEMADRLEDFGGCKIVSFSKISSPDAITDVLKVELTFCSWLKQRHTTICVGENADSL